MPAAQTEQQRHLPLDGPQNFRDLGGYATPGGSTAWGLIYRSDALVNLSEDDFSVLAGRGLRTVLDLRRDVELVELPNAFAGHATVRYVHHSASTLEAGEVSGAERLASLDFRAYYIDMIKRGSETFLHLFQLLGDPASYPIVFHCAGGRDRAGVSAALVLTAAGASREDVIADYLASSVYLQRRVAAMREAFTRQGHDAEAILANLELRESYLTGMLDAIDTEFGGIDGYLEGIGVSAGELSTFRETFIARD
jgi:protein-tyrosine phosphatase